MTEICDTVLQVCNLLQYKKLYLSYHQNWVFLMSQQLDFLKHPWTKFCSLKFPHNIQFLVENKEINYYSPPEIGEVLFMRGDVLQCEAGVLDVFKLISSLNISHSVRLAKRNTIINNPINFRPYPSNTFLHISSPFSLMFVHPSFLPHMRYAFRNARQQSTGWWTINSKNKWRPRRSKIRINKWRDHW